MLASARRIVLAALIVIAATGSDQYAKHLARTRLQQGSTVRVVGSLLVLRYTENQGAFLGLGARWHPLLRRAVFGGLALLIVAGATVYLMRDRRLGLAQTAALSLVVGGGIGNLIDRLTRGGLVTDFLNLGIGALRTGIFNLADLFLVAGVLLFLLARTPPAACAGPRKSVGSPP